MISTNPINPDLGIIGKFQYPLTNCRRFGFASGDSADYFKRRHIAASFVVFFFVPGLQEGFAPSRKSELMNPDNLDLFFHLFEFHIPGNQFCLIVFCCGRGITIGIGHLFTGFELGGLPGQFQIRLNNLDRQG